MLEHALEGSTMTKKKANKKKLRVIMLADESLLPDGDLKDFSEKQRELRKTEFDVRDAMEAIPDNLNFGGQLRFVVKLLKIATTA